MSLRDGGPMKDSDVSQALDILDMRSTAAQALEALRAS